MQYNHIEKSVHQEVPYALPKNSVSDRGSLIEAHLQSDSNKILLIDGARQVGKTYIVRYVGQKLFENYIEINLVEDALGAGLFANVRTVEDFYLQVSMLAGDRMKEKENTLIFLDEIQAYPHHADFPG